MLNPIQSCLFALGACAVISIARAEPFSGFPDSDSGSASPSTQSVDPVSGQNGWTEVKPDFKIQWPNDKPESDRYAVENGVFHLWVLNNDQPFEKGNTTKPRTEQRFQPDYTSGKLHYAADFKIPAGTSNVSVMQIHTGNEQSHDFGSTVFMLFVQDNNGGSLHLYSSAPVLAANLYDKWFHLSVLHDTNAHTVTAWVDGKQIVVHKTNDATDFYMKDGVYSQRGASPKMEVYIKNIKMWKHA